MSGCKNPDCYLKDGESCALGESDPKQCKNWSDEVNKSEEAPKVEAETHRVPWSGSALGPADMAHLVPRGRSILIGVLGAQGSGKTMLLTGTYLKCLQGHRLAGAGFAGSRSLAAWESLAAWSRFDDNARPPSFPPHTPRGTARAPGMLHLALRDEAGAFRDVLFTDAPGEWFTRWAVNENDPEAEGARWVVAHADAFVLLADSARLIGKERGSARREIRDLIERLGNHVGRRPTALVWAKADHQPKPRIREAIQLALETHIPHAVEVSSTTDKPDTLPAAIEAVLKPAWWPPKAHALRPAPLKNTPFLAYRGSYEHA